MKVRGMPQDTYSCIEDHSNSSIRKMNICEFGNTTMDTLEDILLFILLGVKPRP